MDGRGCNGDGVERIRETCSFVICGAIGTSGLIVASERSHSPSRPSDCLSVRLVDYEDVCYLLLASRRDGRRFRRLLPALENKLDEYMAEGFITLRSDATCALLRYTRQMHLHTLHEGASHKTSSQAPLIAGLNLRLP